MHGKRRDRRISDDCPLGLTDESWKQDICVLLEHIHGFYKAALDRLPMRAIPSLAPRLLKAGMCFGFLDPVSNIIANTIAYTPSPMPRSDEEDAPESILSKIITDTDDKYIFEVPLSRHKSAGMTVARRSLDGLVCFLTSHFRYLANEEALHYLSLARADLLAAVRLIEQDRKKRRNDDLAFSITSLTTKVALECAAVSARHPEPDVLVAASLTMASPLIDFSTILAGQDPPSPATLDSLAEFLRNALPSMDLINLSPEKNKKKRKRSHQSIEGSRSHKMHSTFGDTQSLELLLLGKIHGLYLQALAKLPRDGLRKLHHCSLLKGGYCYGPRDPVSNIILNTIWYSSTFPTPQKFELQFKVDMICTDMLARIEYCSLYGLVAFLRTCFPSLTEHDAVWYLFRCDVDVRKAIHQAKKHGHDVCDNYHNAYRQMAVASWHPDPDAMVEFAMFSMNLYSAKSLAKLPGTLTKDVLEFLAMALPHQPTNLVSSSSQVLSKNQERFISVLRKKFKHDQNFFVRKVNEALSNYSQQKGVHYKLHIICGVNPDVPDGPSVALYKKNFKFEYFHINFLATTKGSNSAVTAPELFFAQCSNSVKEKLGRPSWCTPVTVSCIDNVRCFPCEYNGARIVHPYDNTYCGRYEDFIQIAHRKHGIDNNSIIGFGYCHADMMCTLNNDWIYFDPNVDSKMAENDPISDLAKQLGKLKDKRIF